MILLVFTSSPSIALNNSMRHACACTTVHCDFKKYRICMLATLETVRKLMDVTLAYSHYPAQLPMPAGKGFTPLCPTWADSGW